MNKRASKVRKRDFHFQGIHWKRADTASWLAMAMFFVFITVLVSVDAAAVAGAAFVMGWLGAKSG